VDRGVKWSCMESGKQSITSLHQLEMYVCLSVCYKPLDVITSRHPLEMYVCLSVCLLQATRCHYKPPPARNVRVCLSVCYKPLDVITSRHPATEWLACWTQAQKVSVQITVATLSGNSLRQTVHAHCAFIHQAEKLAAALLRVAGVTAGLAESSGSLLPGL